MAEDGLLWSDDEKETPTRDEEELDDWIPKPPPGMESDPPRPLPEMTVRSEGCDIVEFKRLDKERRREEQRLAKESKPVDLAKPRALACKPFEDDRFLQEHYINLARGVPLEALQDDAFKIKDQNFACITVLGPHQYPGIRVQGRDRPYRGWLIKVRGVFRTREEADRHIRRNLMPNDWFSVGLVKCFSWVGTDADIENCENESDHATLVDSVLRGYFENENRRIASMQKRINRTYATAARDEETSRFWRQAHEQPVSLPEEGPLLQYTEDRIKIPGQAYACVSVIRPDEYKASAHRNDQYNGLVVKIRGVFSSLKEAEDHVALRIRRADSRIDVHIVPCFRWAGLEDDCMEECVYTNRDVNELIHGYLRNENNKFKGSERVAEARISRQRAIEQNLDLSTLPYDAQIVTVKEKEGNIPPVPKSSSSSNAKDSEETVVLSTSLTNEDK